MGFLDNQQAQNLCNLYRENVTIKVFQARMKKKVDNEGGPEMQVVLTSKTFPL